MSVINELIELDRLLSGGKGWIGLHAWLGVDRSHRVVVGDTARHTSDKIGLCTTFSALHRLVSQ
jgi:hypothetical protein